MTRYQTTDPKGYWLGRLMAFGFTMDNLNGGNFTEDNLREDLENHDIILHGYTLIEVNYTPEQTDPQTVTVSGKVEFDITMNGQRQTITPAFSHTIKQSWQSTFTAFS
jgi:hypothetical protein